MTTIITTGGRGPTSTFLYGGDLTSRGLAGLHIMTDSVDYARRNWAPQSSFGDSTIIGAPIMNGDNSAILLDARDNYIQSQIRETADATFYWVGRTVDTLADTSTMPEYFSSFGLSGVTGETGNGHGTRFYVSSVGADRLTVGYGTSTVGQSSKTVATLVPNSTFRLMVMKIDSSSGSKKISIRDVTSGTATVETADDGAVPRFPTRQPFAIGSGAAGTGNNHGTSEQSFWAAYNVVTTDAEDENNIADISRLLTGRFPGLGVLNPN